MALRKVSTSVASSRSRLPSLRICPAGLVSSVLSPGAGPIWGVLPLPQTLATPGCVVAFASADGSVQLRQIDRSATGPDGSVYDRTLLRSLTGLERSARSLAAHPDGSLLAAGDGAGNVAVFSLESGAKARHTPSLGRHRQLCVPQRSRAASSELARRREALSDRHIFAGCVDRCP